MNGAIGYADAPDANQAQSGVVPVKLDGHGSGSVDINDGYPFWTTEYAYRLGGTSDDKSLAAAFIDHLTSDSEASMLFTAGYPPCSQNIEICQQR